MEIEKRAPNKPRGIREMRDSKNTLWFKESTGGGWPAASIRFNPDVVYLVSRGMSA
ncbi:MAG: hypothetical protein KH271_23760 [Clostridiales bacterium]|nr:hypothetical protein [Clostridiales bacterium]